MADKRKFNCFKQVALIVLTILPLSKAKAGDQLLVFGRNANNLTGQRSAVLNVSGTFVSISPATAGAVFDESDSDGLGLDSGGINGVLDEEVSKFSRLAGTSASQFEGIAFSFNKPGRLQELMFDGLKDEPLEYFSLITPAGEEFTLFDFEAGLRLEQQGFAFTTGDLQVPNPTLADDASDDFTGLGIPYGVGEVFILSYGEIDFDGAVLPGYAPIDRSTPNGARFQGIRFMTIPEPTSLMLLAIAIGGLSVRLRGKCSFRDLGVVRAG